MYSIYILYVRLDNSQVASGSSRRCQDFPKTQASTLTIANDESISRGPSALELGLPRDVWLQYTVFAKPNSSHLLSHKRSAKAWARVLSRATCG